MDFFVAKLATDEALHAVNRVLRVGHTLALGYLPHQSLTALVHRNNAWRRAITFCICDDLWLTCHHVRKRAVCCTEVDSYNFTHNVTLRS